MTTSIKIILPILALVSSLYLSKRIIDTQEKPTISIEEEPLLRVNTITLKAEKWTHSVKSQGEVYAKTRGSINPEISGLIVKVSPKLNAGEFIKKGEVLAEIDPKQYDLSLNKAKADLTKAEVSFQEEKVRVENLSLSIVNYEALVSQKEFLLVEEKARAQQAELDWELVNNNQPASDLTLRLPQLKTAEADLKSAKADLMKARKELSLTDSFLEKARAEVISAKAEVSERMLDINRCKIRAPFDLRVVDKFIIEGQYVNTSTTVCDIYSIAFAQVDLPISSHDLRYMTLPGDTLTFSRPLPVKFKSLIGDKEIVWDGVINRTKSEIDSESRQHYLIGEVESPFISKYPFKPGLFVTAKIEVGTLHKVFFVPTKILVRQKYLWLIDDKSTLNIKEVEVIDFIGDKAIIRGDGLANQKALVSELSSAKNGLKVIVDEEISKN